ncbi:hypothetical protein [Fibrobacter sp. UWB7]|uniref:hypothetical protein n=1 Tax=Fibrobacter sp. UWB7 TaxID=1896206 RepID=UPI000923E6F5|nr:hypothetical protein [Fibrobacter sp. UWB7]SHM21358.1 hypothetical protein SAMN05720467_0958 [Fibrobacter sp. UWB7]
MKKFIWLIIALFSVAFSTQDRCFEKDSGGFIVNGGDWKKCKSVCSGNGGGNGASRTLACFWGMSESNEDYFKRTYDESVKPENKPYYSLKDYKDNFCVFLAMSIDSAFQKDSPLKVRKSLNAPLAEYLFWSNYRDYLTLCPPNIISRKKWDEHFKECYSYNTCYDGNPYPSDFAEALFADGQKGRLERLSKKELFWFLLLSEYRDSEDSYKKGYFYNLSKKLDQMFELIKGNQTRMKKFKREFNSGMKTKNFITEEFKKTQRKDILLNEYLNYLNDIRKILSEVSPRWIPLIDDEIELHKQIPTECEELLTTGADRKSIKGGIEYIKKICSEYTLTYDLHKRVLDSLEEYYWKGADKYGLYGFYLKNFPNGKYYGLAQNKQKSIFISANEVIKRTEEKFEKGASLDEVIDDLEEYQENFSDFSNGRLNQMIEKYTSVRDTITSYFEKLKSDKDYEYDELFKCSFVSGKNSYKVNSDSLEKLPEKNGKMFCMFPLYASESIFSIVKQELSIKNRKIEDGKEIGFNPSTMEVNYRKTIHSNVEKGFFVYNPYKVLFDKNGYSIKFPKESDFVLEPFAARDIISLLSKNENSAYYLECLPFVLLSDHGLSPSCEDADKAEYNAKIKDGRILSVSFKTDSRSVFIPLNNWGEINGIIKYWDSDIGNVEVAVNASMPSLFDEHGRSKVTKVKIKGCTFTPPRKIISYKNTKYGKEPVYETYSKKCEEVASETGMNLLLNAITPYRYRDGEFIPNFLIRFLDWNSIK